MKIVLAGTPEFSVQTFEEVINNFNVVAIISQPDRPVGRKKIITNTPVKELALKYNIKLFQPEKISDIYDDLKKLEYDIFLTMAYGQIVPENILNIAKKCSINIHGSLLPKYRGAAPIQHSILNGDKETGISLIFMDKKMDAGDILFSEKMKINENENADSVFKRMNDLSKNIIVEWLTKIKNNNFLPIKQDENKVTYANKIKSEDEELKFGTIEKTINKINALSSKPGAYFLDKKTNKRIKVFKAILEFKKNAIPIECEDGIIYGIIYQIEGKQKVIIN